MKRWNARVDYDTDGERSQISGYKRRSRPEKRHPLYDWIVVLDTPPSVSLFTCAALATSDYILAAANSLEELLCWGLGSTQAPRRDGIRTQTSNAGRTMGSFRSIALRLQGRVDAVAG